MKKLGLGSRMALSFIAAAVWIWIWISSGENETGEQIEILFPTEGTEIVAWSQVTFQRSYNVDPEIDFEWYTYRPWWDDIEIVTMNTSTWLTVPTTTGNYRFDVAAYSTDWTLLASTWVTYKVIEAVEPTWWVEILFPTEGSEIVAWSHTFIWSWSTNPASAFKQYSYVVIRSGSTTPLGYWTTTGSNRDFNINTTGDYTFWIAIIDTNNNTIATWSTKFKVIESTSPTTNPTWSITITSSSGQTISSWNNVTFTWTWSITPDSAFSWYGYALSGTDNNYFSSGTLSKTATSYTSPALSSGNYQFIISIIDTGSVSRAINTWYVTVTSWSNNTWGNTWNTATGTVTITSSSGQTISSWNNVTINWTWSITPDSAFGWFYYDLSGTDNSYHTSGSLPKTATGYTSPALSSGNYVFTVSIISLPSQLSASPENEVIATDTWHVTVTYNTSWNWNGWENQWGWGDSTDPDDLNMFIYSPSYSSGQSTIIEDNDVPFSFEWTYPSWHTFIKYQYYIKRNNRDGAVIYSWKYTTGWRQNFTHHLSDGKYYFEATLYTKNSSWVEADKNEGRGFLVFDDIYLDITYPNNNYSCITQTWADFSRTWYAKNTFKSFEYRVQSDNGQYLYTWSTTWSNDTSFPLNDLIEWYYTFSVTMNYASWHSTWKSINFCVSLPEPESSLSITSPVQNKTYTWTSLKFEWNWSYDGWSFSYRYNLSWPTSTWNNNTTAKSFTWNNLRDGTYNFSVEMIDSNGDPIRSLSKKFYVELPYILKIDSPTSWYNSTSSNVSFSWTWTHPYKSWFCYTLSWLNNSTYNSKCTTDTATWLVLWDWRYSFTLNMMATYDNTNPLYSTWIIFNVNSNKNLSVSSSPSWTITGNNVTWVNVTIYWTWNSESFSSYSYTLKKDWATYKTWTSTNIIGSTGYQLLPSGTYKFQINMLNSSNWVITSGETNFKIVIPATLTLNTPVVSTNNVTLWWSGFSENFHHYEYSIDTTDGTRNITSWTWNQSYTWFTIKWLSNGNYRLIVNMKDSTSSTITSDRVQFTIDYTAPTPSWWGGGGWYSSKSHPTNDLSLSIWNDSPSANEWIELIVNISDKYVWKVTFPKIQYYSWNIEKWVDIPVTSKNFVSDYSDDAKLWYVKFSSDDDWEKDLSQFIKFSKNWYYRIYAEDKNWYDAYVQIHVTNKKTTATQNVSTNTWNIDSILREYIPEIFENKDTQEEIYIARSCKKYTIIYSETLNIYTSPNLKISEYFVNKEYLKRYLDSKNRYQQWCPTNVWWISTNYIDRSNDNTRYIAPNGKVYLITWEEGSYYSNELNRELKTPTSFKTIQELKYYIRDRNPLINMATLWPVN